MQIHVREAVIEDLANILNLYSQASMDNGKIISIDQAKLIFNKMKNYPDYKVYVAIVDGETVGTYALAIMDNLGHMGSPSGIIEDVVVRESKQGQGIGKYMMNHAVALCKDKGCYKVALSSNLKREAAHRFYESLGFSKHGYSFLIEY